ncbi:MAG: saccharopine dehydrogenase NADP-binding domain-containing protein [Chloroflexales bacterium]
MDTPFLLYGATGTVGTAIAHLAVQRGVQPILAGRDTAKVKALAASLNLPYRSANVTDSAALTRMLTDVPAVLNCAGPFLYTFQPVVDACLRTGTHYLDITGEIPVYQALAALDQAARRRGITILPGVGFDVVPTDCLAAHLQRRLPSATHLALAFCSEGPTAFPPGTLNTIVEMIPHRQALRRQGGQLEPIPRTGRTRLIDFGAGPVEATMFGWGDVYMAFVSTGIPNIEDYLVLPAPVRQGFALFDALHPLFRLSVVRALAKRQLQAYARTTPERRAQVRTIVWGEVRDDQGRVATARLRGPEAGVIWTAELALAAVRQVLVGQMQPGFQTPARAFGPDFVLEHAGVTREDLDPPAAQ